MKNRFLINVIRRVRSISLKWKLLIPFLFFALSGTTILVYIGLRSQEKMIRNQEKKALLHHYDHFMEEIDSARNHLLGIAIVMAKDRQIQGFLKDGKRADLCHFITPIFKTLNREFGIDFIQFYNKEEILFFELNSLDRNKNRLNKEPGRLIAISMKRGENISGIEKGPYGFTIKGISPVISNGDIVGAMGVGYFLNKRYLNIIRRRWGVDVAIYEITESGTFIPISRAGYLFGAFMINDFIRSVKRLKKIVLIAPDNFPDRSFLYFPLKDVEGKPLILVELSFDREDIQGRLKRIRNIMAVVGFCGISISFALTFFVIYMFLKPIHRIIDEANEIAEGRRERHLEYDAGDEIGTLTQALNRMLDALRSRRRQIQEYAQNLEKRVAERTADLVSTMENYRRLVENIPLIVYRVLPDGTTEFVNPYLTDSLGYTIEEAVGNRNFWKDVICGGEEGFQELIEECFQKGKECRRERKIRDKKGQTLEFIDHAMPFKDADGNIVWVDGTMMDITELKRLQEMAMCSEEIRIVGEISSRMAHEMRNPLATIGGFARRLMRKLPEGDPNRPLAGVIVSEVSRIERFLEVLFSTVKSVELEFDTVNLKEIITLAVHQLRDDIERKGIILIERIDELPEIEGDREKLIRAFRSIIKHSIVLMPVGERMIVKGSIKGDRILIGIRHRIENISDDDISQFFYPHVEQDHWKTVSDLPLARVILHRHGVEIDVRKDDKNRELCMEFAFSQYMIED